MSGDDIAIVALFVPAIGLMTIRNEINGKQAMNCDLAMTLMAITTAVLALAIAWLLFRIATTVGP